MEKKETAPRLRLETLDVRKLKLVFFWVFALGFIVFTFSRHR